MTVVADFLLPVTMVILLTTVPYNSGKTFGSTPASIPLCSNPGIIQMTCTNYSFNYTVNFQQTLSVLFTSKYCCYCSRVSDWNKPRSIVCAANCYFGNTEWNFNFLQVYAYILFFNKSPLLFWIFPFMQCVIWLFVNVKV